MYFWKIEELKESIKNNELSEKDRFIYMLIYTMSFTFFTEVIIWIEWEPYNVLDYVSSISNTLIVLIGTILAFRANGGNNGNDFLGRYFSIGFVVMIRFIFIFIPLYFIVLMFYYTYAFPEDEEMATTIVDTVPLIIWQAALYWRICKHIGDIKNVL